MSDAGREWIWSWYSGNILKRRRPSASETVLMRNFLSWERKKKLSRFRVGWQALVLTRTFTQGFQQGCCTGLLFQCVEDLSAIDFELLPLGFEALLQQARSSRQWNMSHVCLREHHSQDIFTPWSSRMHERKQHHREDNCIFFSSLSLSPLSPRPQLHWNVRFTVKLIHTYLFKYLPTKSSGFCN